MTNKTNLLIATLAVIWGCSAVAGASEPTAGKDIVKSDTVKIGHGQTLRVSVDKGEVEILLGKGPARYEIKISPDLGSSPSQKDYDDSKIAFSPDHGLTVTTGEHLEANVKLWVPSRQPLKSRLSTGTSRIGPLTGKVDAQVGTGTLEYDGSGLPQNACVSASVDTGSVDNKRNLDCKRNDISLHVNTGTIVVK